MSVPDARSKIEEVVLNWSNVTSTPHRFGGTAYWLDEVYEIGHIHGDHVVDILFPRKVRDKLVTAGKAEPHHYVPESGGVSLYLHEADDVDRAIELLRLSYEIAMKT